MIVLDAKGKACPMPVIMAKKQMEQGEAFQIQVDNETAVENLKRLGQSQGAEPTVEEQAGVYTLTFSRGTVPAVEDLPSSAAPTSSGTVFFFGKDYVGDGEAELGKNLIKMMLYTLTQSSDLPAAILLMNSGVHLASTNAETAAHLQTLVDLGCELLVCGTCLNYYGIADQLKVGTVSNMYDILTKMQQANKVITV